MRTGIEGRVAVVCASTSGLGEAIARGLAAEGARVVVTGRRHERVKAVAAELDGAVGIDVDLLEEGGPAELVERVQAELGGIDILVLNGPGPAPATATSLTPDAITQAIGSLVLPHNELIALTLPAMRQAGWGRIVAVGSSGIEAPLANLATSNLGRWALAGYLKTLAAEVAPDGVTVNVLVPGRIDTDRVRELDRQRALREGRTPEQVRTESTGLIPLGRYGEPAEFAAAAVFLCSAAASYVTGTALRCDGGMGGAL